MKDIYICEDHTIIIDGLKLLFHSSADYRISGFSLSGIGVIEKIEREKPAILILDLNLKGSDGLELIEQIRKTNKSLKIVVLTMYPDEFLIERARKLGANAYLQKSVSNEELLEALHKIETSEFYLSKALTEESERRKKFRDHFAHKMKLTKRELELVPLLARGISSAEIADQLSVSALTIDTHRKNIFPKLEINTSIELVNFAHENNLL
ncbi:MAG: response regulator [Cyclobacteriaceae bacterium]|jgi:two-component system nitrate/nitrite response regulator NarL|nr:response regulator transcription factor [Flammeovirgaceae bacterium]